MKKTIALCFAIIFSFTSCKPTVTLPTPAPLHPTIDRIGSVVATGTPLPEVSPSATITVIPTIQFTSSPPASCRVAPVIPILDETSPNLLPVILEEDWAYGLDSAAITVTVYCSYQRSACKDLVLNLANLQEEYKDTIRVIYRHYPQPDVDDKSLIATKAAEAAGIQYRFWEMNNLLYTHQGDWSQLSLEEFTAWLGDQVSSLGINKAKFEADLNSENVREIVDQSLLNAAPLEILGTPVLYFNGLLVKTNVDLESLEVLIQYFLLPEKAYDACPQIVIDAEKKYIAIFKTEKGEVRFELFADKAPWAVNSFVFLAQEGWYDNSAFFRVVPGFVVQGGDPSNSGLGNPGYAYSDEVDPDLRFDTAGMLAMSHAEPDANGSQFFITYTALPELDGQYTIFGRVVEGMGVLSTLRPRNPGTDQILLPPDMLLSITIEEQ